MLSDQERYRQLLADDPSSLGSMNTRSVLFAPIADRLQQVTMPILTQPVAPR